MSDLTPPRDALASAPEAQSRDHLLARIATLEAQVRGLEAERDRAESAAHEQTAALRESEARFRVLADLSPDAMLVTLNGRYVYANPAAAHLLRARGPDDLIGRSPFELVEPEYHEFLRERIQRTLENRGANPLAAMRWRALDGSLVDAESAGAVVTWQGMPAIQVVVRDVTERRQAEAAIRDSEARYRTLFDSIDEGFCVIEVIFDASDKPVDYRFVEGNPAWEKHTGLENAIGRTAREVLPNLEEHWFEIYGKVARTGEPVRFVSGSDVMQRWFDVYAFRVEEPESWRVALLFKDITEHKRSDEERERLLQETERARAEAEAANRAKSEFLAVMSHELRTPLNAIGGYTELLDMGIRGPVTQAQRADLARIQASQLHLLGLINEVLNYAKVETGSVRYDMADVPVKPVLADAETLVAPQVRAKDLSLRVGECSPDLMVHADAEKLRQVLVNLLSNAVKFTDRGVIELRCEVEDRQVVVHVRDTGIGIPPEKLEAVFEPFVQVRADLTRTAEGTGLGLAISRDLARGMGGELTVASTPGEGSTFSLRLPRATM